MSVWTQFWDMSSGGDHKEQWSQIFIEAPEDEAKRIFFARFGHNPERVSCTCCGGDYSINEHESLELATAYHRNCDYVYFRPDGSECSQDEGWVRGKGQQDGYTSRYVERQEPSKIDIRNQCNTTPDDPWGLYITLADYIASADVLVIRADEIKPEWRNANVPEQGYVWVD
jgi:hypothetical protein